MVRGPERVRSPTLEVQDMSGEEEGEEEEGEEEEEVYAPFEPS